MFRTPTPYLQAFGEFDCLPEAKRFLFAPEPNLQLKECLLVPVKLPRLRASLGTIRKGIVIIAPTVIRKKEFEITEDPGD